jgi:hypothetical protein
LRTDLIIRLHGVGEEYGDEWVEYHYRGSATYARRPAWDYPSPDPDKLGPFAPAAPRPLTPAQALDLALRNADHTAPCLFDDPANTVCGSASPAVRRKDIEQHCTCWVRQLATARA